MKLFPVKTCKQLLKDKYNITKGISKYNKQQLNNLLYNCKHNDYLERKNKTYYSTTDMVYMLIKDENITQHIMSYIIDFEYYKQMKDVYTGVLSQLQIFNLSRYSIVSRRFHRGQDDTYNKETMLHIHTHIVNHPTTNPYFITDFVYERIHMLGQYCSDYLENNVFLNSVLDFNKFIVRFKISIIVKFYNYHTYIMYKRYVNTRDNLT
jgi:hypothetical protein